MQHLDEITLSDFKRRVVGRFTRDRTACLDMWLGEEPAWYAALADAPQTAERLAADAGCSAGLVRDLLAGQVAAGRLRYHADRDAYSLNPAAGLN